MSPEQIEQLLRAYAVTLATHRAEIAELRISLTEQRDAIARAADAELAELRDDLRDELRALARRVEALPRDVDRSVV